MGLLQMRQCSALEVLANSAVENCGTESLASEGANSGWLWLGSVMGKLRIA